MKKVIPALPVIRISPAVDFYTEKLGFHCRHSDEVFAILERDRVEIHIWTACDRSWKWRSLLLFLKPVWSGAESFLAGTHSCRIEVDDVDSLFAEYRETGVLYSAREEIENTAWGTREFNALDLHRNLLTFYEPVGE